MLNPHEEFLENLRWLNREIDDVYIKEVLSHTIKEDDTAKLITFFAMILNYTESDQQNIIYKAESSTGKTYIPTEIANFFPKEDIMILSNVSTKAFYHDRGEWDNETKTRHVNLEKKILIFQDQRNAELLKELRPLLSHDSKIITTKITNKNKSQAHRTETICIHGYPTVIFCSAGVYLEEQEFTRSLILSPEATKKKLESTRELLKEKLKNEIEFDKFLNEQEDRQFLTSRINIIRNAKINKIIIPDEIMEEIHSHFIEEHPFPQPRHQRDYRRLIDLIKAHAVFNCPKREILENPTGTKAVIANKEDMYNGYALYYQISESNELGLTPETYNIWIEILQSEINAGLTKRQIQMLYFQQYHRNLSKRRLENIINELMASGLITEEKSQEDRRQTIYTPTQINISGGGDDDINDEDTPSPRDIYL